MYVLQIAIYAAILGSNAIWHYETNWTGLSWLGIIAAWLATQAIALLGRALSRLGSRRRAAGRYEPY